MSVCVIAVRLMLLYHVTLTAAWCQSPSALLWSIVSGSTSMVHACVVDYAVHYVVHML